MATTAAEAPPHEGGEPDGEASPSDQKDSTQQPSQTAGPVSSNGIESISMRADPDAQATVTDYLDFTEYLPADMMRSLTLIGKLDQDYIDASTSVHNLTTTWGKLPSLPAAERPVPVQLKAEISEKLNQAVSSRVYAQAEAGRMAENINRHYNRAKTILSKLQTMMENYPTAEEQKSPVASKSPTLTRNPKITLRLEHGGQRVQRPPRITVPGEVLAPYEVDFNAYTSSDESSEDDVPASPPRRGTLTGQTRIKLVQASKLPKQKLPKPPRQPRTSMSIPSGPNALSLSTSHALAQLKPPPENAVPGSSDAPWLQLTPWELAKLRKRMKKNAVWSPSETMIARELKLLGRGVEAYRAAKKQAEDEGKPFEDALPAPVIDSESGLQHTPEGAIGTEALGNAEVQLSNRGMRLNEAKKLKREALAKLAAEEAEESARKMLEAARAMFVQNGGKSSAAGENSQETPGPTPSKGNGNGNGNGNSSSKSKSKKRKADSMSEAGTEKPEEKEKDKEKEKEKESQPQNPQVKRTKLETPIPPPQLTQRPGSLPPTTGTPVPLPSQVTPSSSNGASQSQTAVPVPTTPSAEPSVAGPSPTVSPSVKSTATSVPAITTTVPTKAPAETPIPPPVLKSTTPIPPPSTKRETRNDVKKSQPLTTSISTRQSLSRAVTPAKSPAPEPPTSAATTSRRPVSRGAKAASQEPPGTLAAERPRRASTARNTPAPEPRQINKRAKRPAPGVITSNSGGTSAVGKRKAAPKKKARAQKKDRSTSIPTEQEVEVEVDDEGNVIDPDEPRYCVCNRVSFGTMIQCDNMDNCKQEWFHLECVGLTAVPPRTTKWYCPECRVLLKIGEKGQVNSRGVKT